MSLKNNIAFYCLLSLCNFSVDWIYLPLGCNITGDYYVSAILSMAKCLIGYIYSWAILSLAKSQIGHSSFWTYFVLGNSRAKGF